MNFRIRIKRIEKQVNELLGEPGKAVLVPTGNWRFDENGLIENSGEFTRMLKGHEKHFGIMLWPGPRLSTSEWSEYVRLGKEERETFGPFKGYELALKQLDELTKAKNGLNLAKQTAEIGKVMVCDGL